MSKIDLNTTLEQVLKDHVKWLNNQGGSRADLSGADLSRANLSGANLSEANLIKANLFRANLSGADLIKANLSGANLFRADLFRANLFRADLSGANLSGANLSGANLSKTVYEDQIPIIINTEYYNIIKTKDFIKIGCKIFTVDEWKAFTDDEINNMDSKALEFWKKYKKLVLLDI